MMGKLIDTNRDNVIVLVLQPSQTIESPRFKVAQDKSLKQAPYDGYSTMAFQNEGLWAKTS